MTHVRNGQNRVSAQPIQASCYQNAKRHVKLAMRAALRGKLRFAPQQTAALIIPLTAAAAARARSSRCNIMSVKIQVACGTMTEDDWIGAYGVEKQGRGIASSVRINAVLIQTVAVSNVGTAIVHGGPSESVTKLI